MLALILGVGVVVYMLWGKISDLFEEVFKLSEEGQRGNSLYFTDDKGEKQIFNYWSVGSYQRLVENGYTVKLWSPSYVLSLVYALHNSGVIVERDDDIKSVIYQCRYKTQFNQLVTYYYNNSNFFEKKDLHDYLTGGLSEDNFKAFNDYLKGLPDGF